MTTKLKILVCTLSVGDEYREITRYATVNKRDYCQKHGYAFVEGSTLYDTSKTAHWSKLILIQKHLSEYDYVVWMDADLYIMNPEITLESFIERIMLDKDIMTGSDWKMSNTGTVFVKNTEWSHTFLQAWLNHKDFPSYGNFEQDAFQDLCGRNIMQAWDHVVSASPVEFNSYWFNYHKGHFIIHMAGCHGGCNLRMMMDKYCPVRMAKDTDDSYQRRMTWLEHQYKLDAEFWLKQSREAETK